MLPCHTHAHEFHRPKARKFVYIESLRNLHIRLLHPYLVNGACPFIGMDVAIESDINPVLLPKPLQVIPTHGLFKWPSSPNQSLEEYPRGWWATKINQGCFHLSTDARHFSRNLYCSEPFLQSRSLSATQKWNMP